MSINDTVDKAFNTTINESVVWSVAGSDCSGLAGQVADIRAIEALGAHPCMITTAVTAQNNSGVMALNSLTREQLDSQFDALKNDFPAKAIKVGLLPTQDSIRSLQDFLKSYAGYLVLDPVMIATSGNQLVEELTIEDYLPLIMQANLITPNLAELALLSQITITDESSIKKAATVLMEHHGAEAVLVKGGHLSEYPQVNHDASYSHDYFLSKTTSFWLHSPVQKTNNTRGTGCVLAASIATALAKGYSIEDSVVIGKMAINQGLRQSYSLPSEDLPQKGPLKITSWPNQSIDLPLLTSELSISTYQFPVCGDESLGLYPVVDRAHWLEKLLPLGVTTIQLRVKDLEGEALEQEIQEAVKIAKDYDARLFINDYWSLAIKYDAYGVHLGQEDLEVADLAAINKAGLRLGLSTHCYYEVARAHAICPSYLACGPVYHTDSKKMPWIPHGIDNLTKWKNLLPEYPWVGIGGINLERFPKVVATGVSGIAMISAITTVDDPETVTKQMIQMFNASDNVGD